MTKIYHYNLAGEYKGEGKAHPDPIDNIPMIPANATITPPPAVGENQVPIFEDGAWVLKNDFRGTEYWLPDGAHRTITEIGETKPNEALDTAPIQPISETQVRNEAARRLNALIAPYSDAERETWAGQVEEAKALQASPDALTAFLTARAKRRSITAAELAAEVRAKDAAFRSASGDILGAQDEILAITPIPQDFADDGYWPILTQEKET